MITLIAALALGAPVFAPITTDGLNLKADGHTILLKGVNLGGWLVEEPWMTPWKADPPQGSNEPKTSNHRALWGEIEKRLGQDAMLRIRNAWRDNWITQTDLDEIKKAGFNHVRIPFLVSILDEPGGLQRLHRAVNLAKDAGLYVVLDMHGAPGGQSDEDHNGLGKSNRLWFEPANIEAFEKAWAKIASEFKESDVAMYDIMNEPMGAPNPAMLAIVYDRVVRAIRKVDPNKVLLIEDGYKGFDTTVHPNVPGWTNICYSLHFYDFDAKTQQQHMDDLNKEIPKIKELQGYRNTPLYIGEFNLEPNAGSDLTHQYVTALAAQGWSWAIWTWKADPASGTLGQWGVMHPIHPSHPIDPFRDDEATMIAKIKEVRTENFEPISGLLEALGK
ncbi:MAG TPA: glycoside hydrolase family 5 protein [Fimbriimonas sp.]|nr:glycoside hydrolase family 5 protein [Fimbriimonas sp.]